MTATRGQLVGSDGEDPAVGRPDQQLVRGEGGHQEGQGIAFLELQL